MLRNGKKRVMINGFCPTTNNNGVLVDSAASTIVVTASENAAISLIPSEIAVDVAAADTSATVAKVIIGTEAGALGVGGTAAVLSDKG